MTYGYTQGGSFGSHKQALGFDASASEKMRVEAAMKERRRQARERAKQLLEDVRRKSDLNKTAISHHEVEARRLIAEVNKEIHDLHELERVLSQLESKTHSDKRKAGDTGNTLLEAHKQEMLKKKEVEDDRRQVERLGNQISSLEQKEEEYKKHIADATLMLQKLMVQIKQLESTESRNQLDISKAHSELLLKQKDIDNKRRLIQTLDQKRMHAVAEAERVREENEKYEREIRELEDEIKREI